MNQSVLIAITALLPAVWGWLVHRLWRQWHSRRKPEPVTLVARAHSDRTDARPPVDYQI